MSALFIQKIQEPYIAPRFRRMIALHVMKNLLKRSDVQVPLLLGIHGPSGEGKTFQLEFILRKMGVKRFLISGGQMEGTVTESPAKLVRNTYIRASESMKGGGSSAAVVLINDVDTGLGSWGEGGKFSVNQQTVFGELMHLVDYPTSVEGHDTLRVPVIITGNDFTKLYDPLVRAGRMEAFEWIPTPDERAEIISTIFPELSQEECRQLIYELSDRVHQEIPNAAKVLSVAFYAHLRSMLLDEDLWQEIERYGIEKTLDNIVVGEEPDLSVGISYDRALNKGIELARSGQLINHLKYANGNGS